MPINPCRKCGGEMRLSAMRVSVNRKRGVAHTIVHMKNTGCDAAQQFTCAMMKPYPKQSAQYPSRAMIERWNEANLENTDAKTQTHSQ